MYNKTIVQKLPQIRFNRLTLSELHTLACPYSMRNLQDRRCRVSLVVSSRIYTSSLHLFLDPMDKQPTVGIYVVCVDLGPPISVYERSPTLQKIM